MAPDDATLPPTTCESTSSWRHRWLAWRDGLLGSASFQRWAARFPLTRPIARRRAAQLFDIVAGFVYSQVLLGCVRLRLFDLLAEGPATTAELAARTGLAGDRLQRLLDAATAIRLVEPRGAGRHGLGPLGAPMVGNEGLALMVEHHTALYADMADPLALLGRAPQHNALAHYWGYAGNPDAAALPEAEVAPYSRLMAASNALVTEQLIDSGALRGRHCLLDVGGGEGVFAAAAAHHRADLRVMLFDLPAVAARARVRLAEQGLAQRVQAHGGDFFRDELPRGADTITLLRVLHDHDDAAVCLLLRNAQRALPPGGTLIVAEPLRDTPGAQAMGDAYFGLYLLAMGRGRPRRFDELGALLGEAGFTPPRRLPTALPLQASVLTATRR